MFKTVWRTIVNRTFRFWLRISEIVWQKQLTSLTTKRGLKKVNWTLFWVLSFKKSFSKFWPRVSARSRETLSNFEDIWRFKTRTLRPLQRIISDTLVQTQPAQILASSLPNSIDLVFDLSLDLSSSRCRSSGKFFMFVVKNLKNSLRFVA